MRVIAGKYRSRPLHSLPGIDLRPTADKLRQALFNVLSPGDPDALAGAIWIDLYAGTGAVGIEALSRGAKYVYFVESAISAANLIQQNLKSLGVADGFVILRQDASCALKALEAREISADFIFLDPPYRMEGAYEAALTGLAQSPLLNAETTVIAEHFKKFDPGDDFADLRRYRTLVQGDGALSFYRRQGKAQITL